MNSQVRPVALITGASSGIGLELAKIFAREGHDLIISSDNRSKLEAAKQQITARAPAANIDIAVADLAKPEGARKLYDDIRTEGITVDVLVNNAGAGVFGDFARETDLDSELGIIQLNVSSVVALAKYFGREMAQRGDGKILFTASEASLAPTAHLTVYAATKALVYWLALGLREELKDSGVTITALMPGATDTGFFTRARMQDTELVKKGGLADPAHVARDGYDALMKGDGHIVTPLKDKMKVAVAKLLPDEMMSRRSSEAPRVAGTLRGRQAPVDCRSEGTRASRGQERRALPADTRDRGVLHCRADRAVARRRAGCGQILPRGLCGLHQGHEKQRAGRLPCPAARADRRQRRRGRSHGERGYCAIAGGCGAGDHRRVGSRS